MAQRTVSIYGGGAAPPGSPDYAAAEKMGALLAGAGYTIMTGGYSGVMEAASKGARDAGGRVVGVTVNRFREQGRDHNTFVDEIISFDTLLERLHYLIARCDAAIAMPGGLGTLGEVALMWNLLQVGEIPPRPLILTGDHWAEVMQVFYGDGRYIREQHMALLQFARTPEQALTILRNWPWI
jgi:hypothetical protein